MKKGNIHKRLTWEDKFARKYCCWVKNNSRLWHVEKVANRKKFRRLMKKEMRENESSD